jgi:carboxypeptidase Q
MQTGVAQGAKMEILVYTFQRRPDTMKYHLVTLLPLVVLSLFSFAQAQTPAAEVAANSNRIASSILLSSQAVESLRELTDMHGGRLAGSEDYERAAEWAAAQFRSYGISNVRLEQFTIPNGWKRGWGWGRIVSPIARHLSLESVGWSPPTAPPRH